MRLRDEGVTEIFKEPVEVEAAGGCCLRHGKVREEHNRVTDEKRKKVVKSGMDCGHSFVCFVAG